MSKTAHPDAIGRGQILKCDNRQSPRVKRPLYRPTTSCIFSAASKSGVGSFSKCVSVSTTHAAHTASMKFRAAMLFFPKILATSPPASI